MAKYKPASRNKILYFLQLTLSPVGSCLLSSLFFPGHALHPRSWPQLTSCWSQWSWAG